MSLATLDIDALRASRQAAVDAARAARLAAVDMIGREVDRDILRKVLTVRLATFARGGGGGKSAKGKAGGKSSKKAKGAVQASRGGACCKTDGGRFAHGNNYGSLAGKGGSAKVAANSARATADKAARRASVKVEATRRGASPSSAIVARSQKAAAMAARVKAAKDHEKATRDKKDARNTAARERRAERAPKAEAAKAERGRAVGRNTPERAAQVAAAKRDLAWQRGNRAGTTMKEAEAARVAQAVSKAGRASAIGRMVAKSKGTAQGKAAAEAKAGKPGGLEVKTFGYSRGKYRLAVDGEEVRPGGMLLSFDKKRDAIAFHEKLNAIGNWKKMDKFTDAQKKQVVAIAKDIEANKSTAAYMRRGDPEASATRGLVEANKQSAAERAQKNAEAVKVRDAENAESERLTAIIRARSKAAAAKTDRAASLKRLTNKSRVASGKSVAENAARERAAEGAKSSPAAKDKATVIASVRADKALKVDKAKAAQGEIAGDVRKAAREAKAAKAKLDRAKAEDPGKEAKGVLGILERQKGEAAAKVAALRQKLADTASSKPASAAQVQAGKEAALAALGPKPTNRLEGKQNDMPTREWLSRKQAIDAKFVPPVAPPPPELRSRPLSDPARMKAEVAKVEEAFEQAPGSGNNMVPLAAVHNALPHLSRQEFVEVVNRARDERKFGLDSAEGLTHSLAPEIEAAAITERGSRLVYISRR